MSEIYTIPAREVVPGMLSPSGKPLSDAVVDALHECGGNVLVSLPGPSPRELCHDLADRLRLWPAPRNGKPWRPATMDAMGRWLTGGSGGWELDHGSCRHSFPMSPSDVRWLATAKVPVAREAMSSYGIRRQERIDGLRQCFYLPKVPE